MRSRVVGTPSEIKAGEFKAKCLELMDAVAETGASIVITKRGTPVARLVPAMDPPSSVFGFAKGSFVEIEDIISPAAPEWRPNESELKLLTSDASSSRRRVRPKKGSAR